MASTSFFDNIDAPAHVFAANETVLLSNTGNCGNEVLSCSGIFVQKNGNSICTFTKCRGECKEFDACIGKNKTGSAINSLVIPFMESISDVPSPSPPAPRRTAKCPFQQELIGYTDMDSIQADLLDGVKAFKLCPESEITGNMKIRLNDETFSIDCWDKSCTWIGEKFHLRVEGADYMFRSSGITFRGATEESVVLGYEMNSDKAFLMEDCSWVGNSGSHALRVDHLTRVRASERSTDFFNGHSGRHRRRSDDRILQDKKNQLRRCSFVRNNVEEVVSTNDSIFSIMNCSFRSNIATGSLIRALNASLEILKTSFIDNSFNTSEGLVRLGDDSDSITIKEVCMRSSAAFDGACHGIIKGARSCLKLAECEDDCVRSWDMLVARVGKGPGTVVLCAKTTIDVPRKLHIHLNKSNTVLQCGQKGLLSDECVISGGSDQVVISASGIVVAGVTFIGSSRVSIRAEANSKATARIRDCHFARHSGASVLLIDHDGEAFLSSNKIPALSEIITTKQQSMRVEMHNCSILDNSVDLAPILVLGGLLTVSSSVFQANEGEVGSIAAVSASKLDFSTSCFLGNAGNSPTKEFASIVFIDKSSELTRNDGNFGLGNEVKGDTCPDGVKLKGNSCLPFEARFCKSPVLDNPEVFTEFSACVNDLETLTSRLSEPERTIEVHICPMAVFDMEDEKSKDILRIKRSNVTLKCGPDGSRDNNCRFTGGKKHIEIAGKVTNVTLMGMTFVGSTISSVSIEGSTPLSVEFIECAWEAAKGESVLSVVSLDPPTDSPTGAPTSAKESDDVFNAEEFSGRRLEQTSFDVSLSYCSFDDNDVTGSLVMSKGCALYVTSCTFSSNRAGAGSITSESGHLAVSATCFDDEGFLVSSDGSSVESVMNYAKQTSNLEGKSCFGVFDMMTEECTSFNSTSCEAVANADCYSDWYNLSNAVNKASTLGEGAVFELCPDTLLEVDKFNPLLLDIDGTVIQCGSNGALENRCSVKGGAIQFLVTGDVMFRGLTFLSSSVAAIHGGGEDSKVASIDNCVFSGHDGLAVVISYLGDIRSQPVKRSGRLREDMLAKTGATMTLNILNCAFTQNAVEFAPLAAFGGDVVLNATTFTKNAGSARAVGIWFGGDLQLGPSCFDDQGTIPSVFIDSGSTVGVIDSSSARKQGSGDDCPGILSGTQCQPIAGQNCELEIVTLPPLGCYSTWVDLRKAITSPYIQGRDSISFSICNDSVLDADAGTVEKAPPITVTGVQVEIKCGKGGSRDDNCIVRGGRSHFKLTGSGITEFSGITFEGASFASILATGETGSVVTFRECTWRVNNGQATFLLTSQLDPDTDLYVGDIIELVETSSGGMAVLTDKCHFENNNNDFAVIANIGGDLNMLETVMINNRGSRFGVIAGVRSATVGLSFTCFAGNSATEQGIVFLDKNSTLALNKNTFASDNAVELDDKCSNIFVETSGSCLTNGICEGECGGFESKTCRVLSNVTNSTSKPSSAPSSIPSALPAASDGDGSIGIDSSTNNPGSGEGDKAGLLAAIIIPLALLGVGVGIFLYRRRAAKASEELDKCKFHDHDGGQGAGAFGDGSQSRSKTQEVEDDDQSEFEVVESADLLNPNTMAQPGDSRGEIFDDENVAGNMSMPFNESSGSIGFNASSRSRGRKSPFAGMTVPPQQKEYVRIPRSIGKKQRSEDIMTFQEIPTTF